jgi:hypothetical protein
MAFNVSTICLRDDPTTNPEDVVKLKLSMDANRLIMHEGMQISKLCVFTDYTEEDFIAVTPRFKDDVNNESMMHRIALEPETYKDCSMAAKHLFKNDKFMEHDKVMYIHPRVQWRNLGHSIIFSTLPDKGNPNHSSFTISEEDRKVIIENNYASMNFCVDWTESEGTQFMPQFFQFIYDEHKELTAKMFDGETLEKYDTFMHFLEAEYDEFVVPMMPATLGKYYACDHAKNKELNEMYEKNVRPLFPTLWRGTGGDEEAKYCSFGHDYRDMTKQTSLLFFDETEGPIQDDYWARMYLLSDAGK